MTIRESLKPYVPLADMLAKTFGKDCEVVLHDLTDPQHSVVYVANNTVTGRQVGESFHQLVDQVLLSPNLKENFVSNYYFHVKNSADGKLVRSSTLLIRTPEGELDGALCINLDTTPIRNLMEALKSYLPSAEPAQTAQAEDSGPALPAMDRQENVSAMVSSLIDHILKDISPDSTRDERVEKIRFMESRGIFLMKGSVEQVAERMGVNKVTVYSYLDEVHGKKRG